MSNALAIFLASGGVAVAAGLIIRLLVQADDRSFDPLAVLDASRDLFAAAAAVFPATLILRKKPVQMSGGQFLGVLGLVLVTALWAWMDGRYLRHFRNGARRRRARGGKLTPPEAAAHPRLVKAAAFVIGNGLGVAVLYFSAALAHEVVG